MYTDLESLTSKIGVKTKANLKVNDIEDKVVKPEGLQNEIESIIEKHKGKKAFLRASGTEDVLRLHVEAETQEQVKAITEEIRKLVEANKELNWVIESIDTYDPSYYHEQHQPNISCISFTFYSIRARLLASYSWLILISSTLRYIILVTLFWFLKALCSYS